MRLVMGKRRLKPTALGIAIVAPAILCAQTPFLASNLGQAASQVGGKSSVDLVVVRGGSPGVPLRHGAVVPGSERVDLDGRTLRRGIEYSIDNEAGVIYLMLTAKPGQSVVCSYRYDPSKAPTEAETTVGGLRPFQFNFAPGAGLMLGMGLTERTADGSVLTSNVYGVNNALSFGSTNLKGVMLYGERVQESAESLMEHQTPGAAQDQGSSRAILQSLQTNFAGGTIQLDYQDISSNFSAFSALNGTYDPAQVGQLAKEKGLKRTGVSLNGIGALGFSGSYRTVGDGDSGVTWQSFGMNSGGLKLDYSARQIDQSFNRFKDLAESDREQLAREAGLSRENWSGSWNSGIGAFGFKGFTVEDANGQGIRKQEFSFDSDKFKFMAGSQRIAKGFTRFDSLFEQEKGQWGREAGLNRQWASLEAAIFGGAGSPLKFTHSQVSSANGSLDAMDATLGGKGWSLEHITRGVDSGFASIPNLTPQEIDGHISAISKMYTKDGLQVRPEDRAWFQRSPGLSREFTRFTATPYAGWDLSIESLALQGQQDKASQQEINLKTKGLAVNYRTQDFGEKFNEVNSLMDFEKQRLGTLSGLQRTDLGLVADMKGAKVDYSQTTAETPNGGFDRKSLQYKDRQLDVKVNSREIDPGFSAANQILDPERDLLAGLVGYKQTDAQIRWQLASNFKVEAMGFAGENDALAQKRLASQILLNWAPDSATALEYFKSDLRQNDPASLLFAQTVERMSLSRDLGRLGKLRLGQQVIDFAGTQSNQPDSRQVSLAYEAKVDDRTSLKTEQVRTSYENGDKENISANSVSTQLSEKMGLSLTDVSIDRGGKDRDERKQNLGFWLMLWGGVKLNFGINGQLNNAGTDFQQTGLSLTPGTIGNLEVKSASYMASEWEQAGRVQANSAVSLSTAKPFRIGPFEDMKLSLGQDTAADQGRWLRENKAFALNGRLGKKTFGFEYRSQINELEERAVDRAFTLSTDQSENSRLKANLSYKLRTLPDDETVAIRNFSVVAKPANNLEITHQMLTNPEVPRGDKLLGSDTQPIRVNKWKLDYVQGPDLKLSGSWEEQRNDQNDSLARIGGLTLTLFEGKGSPLSLFYGIEQLDGDNVDRRMIDRWSLRYDQRPGPNQVFSLYVGNVTYGATIAPNEKRNNLTAALEYQLRF